MLMLLNNWRLIAAGAGVLALLLIGWRVAGWREQAQKVGELEAALNQAQQNQERTRSVGIDLNNGNNVYRPAARELDRKVQNETLSPATARFDANGLRLTKERIAAGNAARRSAE